MRRKLLIALVSIVVIAYGGEARIGAFGVADQQLQQLILGSVGVLVFIDQHMAHLLLPAGPDFCVLLQQFQRQANQIVKVHALVGAQSLFVAGHDACEYPFVVILGPCFGLAGVQPHVFPLADGPLPLACRGGIGAAPEIGRAHV